MLVLTHNAYFHKEVTYWGSRDTLSKSNGIVAYFVIRKNNNISHIEECSNNPITSTYELLWDDIKNHQSSANTICNTMRRILEHYFKVIGLTTILQDYRQMMLNHIIVCLNKFLLKWGKSNITI